MTAATPLKINWLIGTFAAMALFAVFAAYSSSVARHTSDYDQQRAEERTALLKALQADAAKTLYGPADWVDQTKGTVRIPIDEAMTEEINTLKMQPARQGAELPPPPPAPHPKPAQVVPILGNLPYMGSATTAPAPASTNAAPVQGSAPAAPPTPAKPN